MAENCVHGLPSSWCSYCTPRQPTFQKKIPKATKTATLFGANAINSESVNEAGYVLVKTYHDKNHRTFERLNATTKLVHIDGYPFVWAIGLILERAPSVEVIQVIPSMHKKLTKTHFSQCEERHVRVVPGHYAPHLAWEDGRIVSPHYRWQKKFFSELAGEQKQLFDELLLMKAESAEIVARYFCLKGEHYVSQIQIGIEYGFAPTASGHLSDLVKSVIRYLDPTFDAGLGGNRKANALKQRVERFRRNYGEIRELGGVMSRLKEVIASIRPDIVIPQDLPIARFETFEKLVTASTDGRLESLRKESENRYRTLALRFGIFDGSYRTLQTVADLTGKTRERVRQLEESGLAFLEIAED